MSTLPTTHFVTRCLSKRLCLGLLAVTPILATSACAPSGPPSVALIEPSYSYVDAGITLTRSPLSIGAAQARVEP